MSASGTQSEYRPARPLPGKGRRSVILAVIAGVVGIAALVGVALLTSSGSTEVRLGDDQFEVGEAATLADTVEANGAPLLFQDLLVGDSRDIYVHHVGNKGRHRLGHVRRPSAQGALASARSNGTAHGTCSLIPAPTRRSRRTAASYRTTRPG